MKKGLNSFGDLNTQDYVVLWDNTRFSEGLKYCTGFSVLNNDGYLIYKLMGNMLFCAYFFRGTSNATTKTFTIPLPQGVQFNQTQNQFIARISNNGGAGAAGLVRVLAANGAISAQVFNGITTWTASGNAFFIGQFMIPINL